MEMFKAPDTNSNYQYQYQPIGASSAIDPRIQKTKDLFQMFHLAPCLLGMKSLTMHEEYRSQLIEPTNSMGSVGFEHFM
jgi:hypothetical protein